MALKHCRDAEREMLMAEQDELAADTNTETETEEIAEVEDLPQEITEPTELVFQSRSLTSVRELYQLAEYTITSPGLTADEDAVWGQVGTVDDDEVGGSPELTGGISMRLGNRQQQ